MLTLCYARASPEVTPGSTHDLCTGADLRQVRCQAQGFQASGQPGDQAGVSSQMPGGAQMVSSWNATTNYVFKIYLIKFSEYIIN